MLALALAVTSMADVNAAARAEGNRRVQAVAIGRALLRRTWPAQILKIRVDGIGTHSVAGLVLSGVKFHAPLDSRAFVAELSQLVTQAFAAAPVEEIDVWATVPLPPFAQKPVNGEYLQPTDRVVYGASVLRSQASALGARLDGKATYWDARWKRTLDATPPGR